MQLPSSRKSPLDSFFAPGPAILLGVGVGLTYVMVETVPPPLFSPGAGVKVERTYTWSESSRTTSVEITLDGEPTQEVPAVSSEFETEASLEVIDTFSESDVNRPLRLTRSFEDISLESEGTLMLDAGAGVAELAISCEGDSELDGVAVSFAWNEESERYDRKYAEDYEGQDELLEPLQPDGDFIGLLPPHDEDVEVGAAWEVDASALRAVLLPGGRVPVIRESDMDVIEGALDPLLMPGVLETLDGAPSGDISVVVKAASEGALTMVLTVDVEFVSDQSNAVGAMLSAVAPEDVNVDLETATYTSTLEGKGTLIWDTERNLARSFRLDLETALEIYLAVQVEGLGIDAPFELREEREGTLRIDMVTAD